MIMPLVVRTDITDHFTIILQIIFGNKKPEINKLNYVTHINNKTLLNLISRISWDEVIRESSVELATKNFIGIPQFCVSDSTYKFEIKSSKKRHKWITKSLIQSVNKKNQMYILSNNPENLVLQNEYKKYKNTFNKFIKTIRNIFLKNQIDRDKNNTRNLWQSINDLFNRNNKLIINKVSDESGNVVTDLEKTPNIFNNTYIEI